MTNVDVPGWTARIGRLGTVAAWISAICCLPYLVLKVLWTANVPVGLSDRSVLDSNGWVASNAVMALMQLVGLLLVIALVRPWSRRLPKWLILFPAWVGIGILFQVAVGAVLLGLFSPPSQTSSDDTGGIRLWVYLMVYAAFTGQGVALAIAFTCHVRGRWGRLMRALTGDALARRRIRVRSWPENHLAQLAQTVAGMAVAVTLVLVYWAAGGSFGLAGEHPSWAMQTSRVVGAVIAVVGLLGLAGRWGRRRRFWLPVGFTWLGSGALVAFDALVLTANKVSLAFAADYPEPWWTLSDTVIVVKLLIGVLAAAIGVVALAAAAKEVGFADRDHGAAPPLTAADLRGYDHIDGVSRPRPVVAAKINVDGPVREGAAGSSRRRRSTAGPGRPRSR